MEEPNLQAASTYINNLLLARGLLKNGKPIDFASPNTSSEGANATMTRIINLVNDLVLRRDREAEHREDLATSIRTLKDTESRQILDIERLGVKNADLTRSLALAESQERAFRASMGEAENTIRSLKEQMQRMKSTIQHIRAQCSSDIRKRDVEIQKLKTHLAERQRGKREGLGVTTISISPKSDQASKRRPASAGVDVNDPGYSLRQETSEFLTELCQNLSDENDYLIALVRNSIRTLRDLQGIPSVGENSGNQVGAAHEGAYELVTPTSCEELSRDFDAVLDHLTKLLTNPSFVPLEEVEMRDEEIMRLREGWDEMESKWKEAIVMMDDWHKRICDGRDIEDLRAGIRPPPNVDVVKNARVGNISDMQRSSTVHSGETKNHESVSMFNRSEGHEASQITASIGNAKPSKHRPLEETTDNIGSRTLPQKVSFQRDFVNASSDNDEAESESIMKGHMADAIVQRPVRNKTESKILQRPRRRPRRSDEEKLGAVRSKARGTVEKARTGSRKRTRITKDLGRQTRRRRSTLSQNEPGQSLSGDSD